MRGAPRSVSPGFEEAGIFQPRWFESPSLVSSPSPLRLSLAAEDVRHAELCSVGGRCKGWEEAVGCGSMGLGARALGLEGSLLKLVLPLLSVVRVKP